MAKFPAGMFWCCLCPSLAGWPLDPQSLNKGLLMKGNPRLALCWRSYSLTSPSFHPPSSLCWPVWFLAGHFLQPGRQRVILSGVCHLSSSESSGYFQCWGSRVCCIWGASQWMCPVLLELLACWAWLDRQGSSLSPLANRGWGMLKPVNQAN